LKEKRNSLRSLWRRSLVILSILALVFAVACGSKGGDPTTPPTDPTDPGTPTQPAAKVATKINVIFDPSVVSYVGQRPDLTGIKAEVWFSDNSFEIITDTTQFMTEPLYLPATSWNISTFAPVGAGGAKVPVVNSVKGPVQIRVFHVSGGTVSVPVNLPVVWNISQLWDGTSILADPNGINFTGTLTKQDYYEDDFPDFAGITAEVKYVGYDLDTDPDGVSAVGELGSFKTGTPISYLTGLAVADAADVLVTYRENPQAWTSVMNNYPDIRKSIQLDFSYVDKTHGIYGTGINGKAKTIAIRFPGETGLKYTFPFKNFYPIRGIAVANRGSLTFGDYYQWDITRIEWIEELFGKAGLQLTVYYSGVETSGQTRTIGLKEFRRANALKWYADTTDTAIPSGLAGERVARMIAPPERYSEDLDTVIARLGYFSKQVVFPEGSGAVGGSELPDDTFPNQVIDLNIPIWEFTGDIRFDRRANMPDIPLYIDGYNAFGETNANPLGALGGAPPHGLINQIRQTYQLVAVYNRADKPGEEKVRDISALIWRSSAPNAQTSISTGATNWWNALTYVNVSEEIEEVDLSFTIPGESAIETAITYNFNNIRFQPGARLLGTEEADLTTAQALAARRAFAGLSADLEPAVVVLPYHEPLP